MFFFVFVFLKEDGEKSPSVILGASVAARGIPLFLLFSVLVVFISVL